MSERKITKEQEEILRLCHHEFGFGLSQKQAAARLGISRAIVSQQLKIVKEVMPQFFPILTKMEYQIYDFYMNWPGWDVKTVAVYLSKTESAIYASLSRAFKKGMRRRKAHGKILSYDTLCDKYGEGWVREHVKKQF